MTTHFSVDSLTNLKTWPDPTVSNEAESTMKRPTEWEGNGRRLRKMEEWPTESILQRQCRTRKQQIQQSDIRVTMKRASVPAMIDFLSGRSSAETL